MTAVVVAAVPAVRSPSSADFSATNVAFYVSLHSSPSPFFSSSPKLLAKRKTLRRSSRRLLEATEDSSFVYFSIKGIANGPQGSDGKQLASRRNARLTRANAQGEESVSMARISWVSNCDEGKLLWALHKRQSRCVKASAMHRTGDSKISEFVHSSDSHDTVARDQERAWPKLGRSLSDEQQYAGSSAVKKHPRSPLPTQNQQHRLHNKLTVFEGIRQPRVMGRPGDTRAHYHSLPRHADNVISNIKQQGSELDISRMGSRQRHHKGALFTSKLEEVLSNFEKKNDFIKQSLALRGDSTSSMHTVSGPQDLRGEGEIRVHGVGLLLERKDAEGTRISDFGNSAKGTTSTIAKDNQGGQHGEGKYTSINTRKGLPSDLGPNKLLMKTARGDEAGFTSFNLFSSPPTVPWEAHRSCSSSFKPTLKNRSPPGRRLPTSIGSRSSPSQRSTINRNKGRLSSQAVTVVGGDSGASIGDKQKDWCSNDSITQGDKVKIQVGSQGGAVESNQKLDSEAESGITGALESGNRQKIMEPGSAVKEDIVTQGAQRLKNDKLITQRIVTKGSPQSVEQVESLFDWSDSDVEERVEYALPTNFTAKKVLPSKSRPFSSSLHNGQTHFYLDREDDIDDAFEPSLDARDDEDNVHTESNFCKDAGDKVSVGLSDAEDDISTRSSAKMEGRDSYGTSQLNYSERYPANVKHNLATATISTEHMSSATPAMDASSDAFETCNHGRSPTSETWHNHNLSDLPFEFQFSYTETPKQPILGYRETPFSPFGPSTMGRPWIGDKPHKPSKKKQRVFDSFKPPPKYLKGVKFVQDPGPYPEGQGPQVAKSREEIMGEPLTKEEIVYLVEKCKREKRQLNLGRDGLTHNMLDLIHSYWKRRRVCRIKCKGVPTVDMENVKLHLEEKSGGKIIYHAGGVVYLFRGRNYNYKDRPNIPLMLWKPPAPVYPALIQPAPEGLTKEEADGLRRLGRKVEPICKLGKNGVYLTLADEVRAAFRVDELVRVDCRGLNPSDYKKIGAKLRDLVPCVLLSFDKEHILMWKGKEDCSSVEGTCVSQSSDSQVTLDDTDNDAELFDPSTVNGDKKIFRPSAVAQDPGEVGEARVPLTRLTTISPKKHENSSEEALPLEVVSKQSEHKRSAMGEHGVSDTSTNLDNFRLCEHEMTTIGHTGSDTLSESGDNSIKSALTTAGDEELSKALRSGPSIHEVEVEKEAFDNLSNEDGQVHVGNNSLVDFMVDIDGLWEHAFQCGMAIELSEENMDSDQIIRKAEELVQSAPLAPTYTTKLMYKLQLKRQPDYKPRDDLQIHFGRVLSLKPKRAVEKRKPQPTTASIPRMGGLPVDEVAKLLVKQ